MTLEHAALEADIEERQNEELLLGMTRILNRIESMEGRILSLEGQIAKSLGVTLTADTAGAPTPEKPSAGQP